MSRRTRQFSLPAILTRDTSPRFALIDDSESDRFNAVPENGRKKKFSRRQSNFEARKSRQNCGSRNRTVGANQMLSSEGIELGTPGHYRLRRDADRPAVEHDACLNEHHAAERLSRNSETFVVVELPVEVSQTAYKSPDTSSPEASPSSSSVVSSEPDLIRLEPNPVSGNCLRVESCHRAGNVASRRKLRRKTPSMLLDIVVSDEQEPLLEPSDSPEKLPADVEKPAMSLLSSPPLFRYGRLSRGFWDRPDASYERLHSPPKSAPPFKTCTLPPNLSPRDFEKPQGLRFSFHKNLFRKFARKTSVELLVSSVSPQENNFHADLSHDDIC